ncbi:type IV toxin-antitoxin system AbiEi family antitoxin [Candidatus Mycobacterium methanotrophicum]|uniref:Type IV toxin-antitoxin system AbiEi family antitoxin n=1 Tax=Candidatus Mycobacterium methanotrophicum TaxID=2943498 RepID=A0ABY4QIW8_9MYCO|nr:type IV toxin-antitoxin system AbiEi family antitoxin [Candidatus Mycobacterium methanotrophicum]UQX10177.1 type IV toxin-antitoxin system AbiEi family antitoxin [Candidatus Mycobacterium methanotrophicum]
MSEVFVGTEMLGDGGLTRGQLRWNYRSIYPDIYVPRATAPSLWRNTVGAWLWSRRNGVIAGRAAAALHGALWVDRATPIEMIWRSSRPPSGIVVRNERIDLDEIVDIDHMRVTSPARTALDLARHLPRDLAVRHLDALARATGVNTSDVLSLAERYPRARGLRRSAVALDLMDAGAQSPRETWLRLVLIDAGLPRPRTQIRVTDGVNEAFVDMGYDEPMIGLDYDGQHHSADRWQYVHDIGRAELIERQGWIDLHVVAEHSRRFVIRRLSDAFARRGYRLRLRPGS